MDGEITDTDRINAIESGFCVTAQDERTPKGWVRFWTAAWGPGVAWRGDTLREAVDLAIIAAHHIRH